MDYFSFIMLKTFVSTTKNIDGIIQHWIMSLRTPGWDEFFVFVTGMGSPPVFIIIGILAFVVLLMCHKWLEGAALIPYLIISWASMEYLKIIFGRSRPAGEALAFASGYSFPSGHAMLATAFYGFLAYLVWKNHQNTAGRIAFFSICLLIFLIGLSRVYLNVHYTSDVLTGFILGGLLLFVFIKVLKMIRFRFFLKKKML